MEDANPLACQCMGRSDRIAQNVGARAFSSWPGSILKILGRIAMLRSPATYLSKLIAIRLRWARLSEITRYPTRSVLLDKQFPQIQGDFAGG